MADKTLVIGEILRVMAERWDLPPDCNEGELFTYAEILFDRITAGESKTALTAWLSSVQTKTLQMPTSEAAGEIVDRAAALVANWQ